MTKLQIQITKSLVIVLITSTIGLLSYSAKVAYDSYRKSESIGREHLQYDERELNKSRGLLKFLKEAESITMRMGIRSDTLDKMADEIDHLDKKSLVSLQKEVAAAPKEVADDLASLNRYSPEVRTIGGEIKEELARLLKAEINFWNAVSAYIDVKLDRSSSPSRQKQSRKALASSAFEYRYERRSLSAVTLRAIDMTPQILKETEAQHEIYLFELKELQEKFMLGSAGILISYIVLSILIQRVIAWFKQKPKDQTKIIITK